MNPEESFIESQKHRYLKLFRDARSFIQLHIDFLFLKYYLNYIRSYL